MSTTAAASCSSASLGPANQLLALLIQSLFTQQQKDTVNAEQCSLVPNWPADFGPKFKENEPFDFIVVGGGSAGSIVAARLSENPNWNVLLLEAGGVPPLESEIPLLYSDLINEQYDWNNFCEPSQTASLGLTNSSCFLARGKLLGGCGAHNTLVYNRGNENDYNRWSSFGNPTWDWDSVLPYFKKSENNQNATIAADTEFHSTAGPLKVNNFSYDSDTLEAVENIFAELGFDFIEDINAGQHIGYGIAQGTLANGTRVSSAKAYLIPAQKRSNLKIIYNAQITTLNFNKDQSIAGVNFVLNGKNLTAVANREVILSAGVVNTPVILLNSGIGPASQLNSFKIPVISNISVGQNLQDHTIFIYPISLTPPSSTPAPSTQSSYLQYLTNRTGQFANIGAIGFTAYTSTKNSQFPDIQYFASEVPLNNTATVAGLAGFFNLNSDITEFFTNLNEDLAMVWLLVVLINPTSRGQIELQSNNPLDKPKIFSNLLSESADVATLLKAVRKIQSMNQTEAFKANDGQFVRVPLAACDTITFDTDAYWECNIRHLSTLLSHTVGTAKMGPATDGTAVVDSQLRVRGVQGLRVIDASIMPTVTSGNTNAPTMMIAEKGSDFIKASWTNPTGWYLNRTLLL